MSLYFLQPGLWNVQGSVTVVGVLLVVVLSLFYGLLSPKHTVQDLRDRLHESEAENAALSKDVIRRIEENAELRGELAALRREIEELRREVHLLRGERGRGVPGNYGEQGSQGGRI